MKPFDLRRRVAEPAPKVAEPKKETKPIQLAFIGAAAFNSNIRRKETVGRTSLSELDQMIKERKQAEMPEDTKELRKLVIEKLPEIYHDYMDVFSKAEAHKMPPHRPYDHKIVLDAPWDFKYSPL